MELRRLYDATDWYWDSLPYRFTYGRAYSCLAKRIRQNGWLKDSRSPARILDCGIGAGLFSAALAHTFHSPLQLFGVDLSSKLLARAARRLRRENALSRLLIGDVSLLPVRTASMDCVIAALVLEHVPDPQAAICELARVAAPEAPVVVVATRPHAPDRLFRIVYRYRHYRPEELRHWMSQAGLTAVRSYNLCGIARLFAVAYIGARCSHMGVRRLLDPNMEAAAAAWGFGCPSGYGGAIIGYLMALTHGRRSNWILDRLAISPSDRVLEIGFGPGTEIKRAAQLASQGFVAGIDVSTVMLRQALRRNREYVRQGRVELRLASMQEIPYPSRYFDKVFAVNSIQFATDLSQALKEIGRVLKPGRVAALAVQPLWKGASDATAVEIGRSLASAMMEAGFRGIEAAERRLWPRNMVCVFGRAPEPGGSLSDSREGDSLQCQHM